MRITGFFLKTVPDNAEAAFNRFRFPLVFAMLASAMAIFLVYHDTHRDYIKNMIMALYLAYPFFIALTLFFEKHELKPLPRCAVELFFTAAAIGYFFSLPKELSDVDVYRFVMFNISSWLLIFWINSGAVRNLALKLWTRIGYSAFISGVIYFGLMSAVLSIHSLFNMKFDEGKLLLSIFIVSGGVIAPWIFAAGVPGKDEALSLEVNEKYYSILTKFVLIPLVSFYMAILYLYFAKVIVLAQMPKGLISYLILSFSAVGVIAYFLSAKEAKDTEKTLHRLFSKLLFPVILPLTGLLWYAIAKRVLEYGVTENRYIIVALAVWLTGITLYFIISKKKELIILPASLSLIAFLISFGPWGMFDVSYKSQHNRLITLLEKYDLLENGRITALKGKMEFDDRKELSGILDYFESSRGMRVLADLIPADVAIKQDDNYGRGIFFRYGNYENTKAVMNKIGVKYVSRWESKENSEYFSLYLDVNAGYTAEVKGYDHFFQIVCSEYGSYSKKDNKYIENTKGRTTMQSGDITLELADNCQTLSVAKAGEVLYKKNISQFYYDLINSKKNSEVHKDAAEMTFTDSSEKAKIYIILKQVYGNRKNNILTMSNVTAEVFVGEK